MRFRATALVSGCASPAVALTFKTPTPSLGPTNGLVLLVIETTKDQVGGLKRMPVVGGLEITAQADQKTSTYSVPADVVTGGSNGVTHLISFSLPTGEYALTKMWGYGLLPRQVEKSKSGHAGFGNFSFPLDTPISSSAGKVVYAGHIKAHMRHRDLPTEEHAGSMIPLLDQQVAGFYPTTFDVTTTDDFENDADRFSTMFRAMKKDEIGKSEAIGHEP